MQTQKYKLLKPWRDINGNLVAESASGAFVAFISNFNNRHFTGKFHPDFVNADTISSDDIESVKNSMEGILSRNQFLFITEKQASLI